MEDAVLDYGVRRYCMVRNWREVVGRVRDAVLEMFPEARVYVFGSVIEGRVTASSDIDVLIVIPGLVGGVREKAEIQAKIEDKAGLSEVNPVEFHIVTPEEAEWYFKTLKIRYVEA